MWYPNLRLAVITVTWGSYELCRGLRWRSGAEMFYYQLPATLKLPELGFCYSVKWINETINLLLSVCHVPHTLPAVSEITFPICCPPPNNYWKFWISSCSIKPLCVSMFSIVFLNFKLYFFSFINQLSGGGVSALIHLWSYWFISVPQTEITPLI